MKGKGCLKSLPALETDCHELTVKKDIMKRKLSEAAVVAKPVGSYFLDLHGVQQKPEKMPHKPCLEKRDSLALRKNSNDTNSTVLSINDFKRTKYI